MRAIRVTAVFIAVLLFASITHAEKMQADPPGLAIGKKAPDFELKDQQGKTIKLSALAKKGPVAVVFHRSADW